MIHGALVGWASRTPDHPAMISEGREISFRGLTEKSARVAAAFADSGLRRGDRVLVMLGNGPEYAAVFFGLLAAGGVMVPLNPSNTAESVRYIAQHCQARLAVSNESAFAHLAEWWSGAPVFLDGPPVQGTLSLAEILETGTPPPIDVRLPDHGDQEPALLLYTSGTTGVPKGVMLSQENLVANTKSILEYMRLEPSDRTLAILPFYYSYGNSLLLTHVFAGATLVIENKFAYISKALSVMRDRGVTGFSGVPSHYAMLIGRSKFLESDWPHLRYMTCAGGPLPVAHIQRIRTALPNVQLHVMYGQTEGTARLSSLDPSLVDRKVGSIGRGIPGVELRVLDKDGRDVEPGDIGEIVARGKNIMIGYLEDPAGTAEVLRNGWLHTGDLATVDGEGFIYIRGREKEFIKSGGYRIGPQQIEDVILQHQSVQECGVIGTPDELLGEQVLAFAVFRPEADNGNASEDLLIFLRERLPPYMVPSRIVSIDALPKTETGKVKRQKLRELISPVNIGIREENRHPGRTKVSMLLHEILVNSARANPDKTALVAAGMNWTYGDLDRASDAFAGALLQKGFRLGDRLGICLGNTVETVVGIFGVLKAGGAFVLVNPAVKRNKLVYILSNARCAALLSSAEKLGGNPGDFLDAVPSIQQAYLTNGGEGENPRLHSYHDAVNNPPAFRPPALVDVDLAALIYTSGSTGIPKGTVLTHLNMVAAARSIASYLEIGSEDVVLNVLPVSFDYGLYQVLLMFMVGGTVVFAEPFSYPQQIVKEIREHGVTGLPCVPPMFSLLSRLGGNQSREIPTLRFITNTGAAPNVKAILKLRELLPAVRLYLMYGLTECKRVSYLPPEEVERRTGSVGKPMPNVGVRILKENREEAGPGETGELVVRGSNVMQGYWEDPETTSRTLRPGRFPWEKELYTGDLFRTDEEGFLYFLGRKDDIIKIRGEKVSPKEIENVILGLDGVREVVVVGVPDDVFGQAIRAHVVREETGTLTGDQVREHCARNLENSSVPKTVVFHEAIPRNSSGKVDKALLAGPNGK